MDGGSLVTKYAYNPHFECGEEKRRKRRSTSTMMNKRLQQQDLGIRLKESKPFPKWRNLGDS